MKASSLRISTYRNWLTSDLSEGTGTVESDGSLDKEATSYNDIF